MLNSIDYEEVIKKFEGCRDEAQIKALKDNARSGDLLLINHRDAEFCSWIQVMIVKVKEDKKCSFLVCEPDENKSLSIFPISHEDYNIASVKEFVF